MAGREHLALPPAQRSDGAAFHQLEREAALPRQRLQRQLARVGADLAGVRAPRWS